VAKPVEIKPGALEELSDAAEWLNEQQPGLGDELVGEVRAAIHRLAEEPKACTPVRGAKNVRSIRVKRFRYRVYFVEGRTRIRVLAITHTRREHWKKRR
jgi:plasmid stabilization system protein ParE